MGIGSLWALDPEKAVKAGVFAQMSNWQVVGESLSVERLTIRGDQENRGNTCDIVDFRFWHGLCEHWFLTS
jgi:hypothetical protein